MSRRRATILAVVVLAVLALIVFLPAFPPVRELIVQRVVTELERSGTRVTYAGTAGNAWRGVTLLGASAEGPGIDVDVDRLHVGYFLPSLIGGELPLDIEVDGARGSLDVSRFLTGAAGGPGAAPGPIVVRLRRLSLDDVAVDVEELPFTLPDANVSDLQVTQRGTALDLAATVTTADGSAAFTGRFDTLTGALDALIDRADATLARQWWRGVTAGEVTGTLRVRGGAITGSFDVRGGAVDDIGLLADDVSGHVELDYPVITAELTGTALGGRVDARGVVNVEAQRWEAQATATPQLAQAAAWLLRGSYPDGPPVALEGSADVTLRLSGWDHVVLEGTADGDGAVEGLPLEDLSTAFRLPRDGRIRAEGRARLGGGDVRFEAGPDDTGDNLRVTARGVGLDALGEGLGTVDARLRLALDGRQDGELELAWGGRIGGREAQARLDARLDPDGWQGFVSGSDAAGAELEGALVLAGDRLQGGATVTGAGLAPLPDGTVVSLALSGPSSLRGARVSLGIEGDDPVTLPGLAPGVDLRGSASGVLEGDRIAGLVGQFGPVVVSGALDLSPLALVADVIVEPTRLELVGGDVAARVTVPSSSLVYGPDGLSWRGRVTHSGLTAGPLATPAGALVAAFGSSGDGWRASATSEAGDLSLEAGPAGLTVALDGLPVTVVGSEGGPPTLSLAASGRAEVPLGEAGRAAALELTLADAGDGAVTLPAELRLAGVSDGGAGLDLSGSLGDLPVDVTVSWEGPFRLAAGVGPGGPERLSARYDAGSGLVAAAGRVDVATFWRLATGGAPPAEGTLELDLEARVADGAVAGVTGDAALTLSSPLVARASVSGQGDALATALEADLAGVPVVGSGRVPLAALSADTPLLTLDAGPLEGLTLTASGLSGEGVLPAVAAGPATVPATPWRLGASWSGAPTALLRLADSEARLTLAGDAVQVAGALTVPAEYAGEELELTLDVPEGRVRLDGPASTRLRLALARPGGPPLVEAEGTLAELVVSGALPAELLAAPLPADARPTGTLAVGGTADLLARRATVSLGDGLTATYDAGDLVVTARQADLTPHLPSQAPTGLSVTVDGALELRAGAGWLGELTAALVLPGDEPAAADVRLTGAGAELLFDVSASGPLQSTLHASGTLAPETRLKGRAEALGGAVTAALDAAPEAGVVVALTSGALVGEPYLSVPPLSATLTVPADGRAPRLAGDWIDVRVAADGALEGRVELPFTLLGQPAALRADVGGTLAAPLAAATLEGAGVQAVAEASLGAAWAELTLDQPAVAAALPPAAGAVSAVLATPVAARAEWAPETGWRLTAGARAEVPTAGPIDLALDLAGDGAAYAGQLAASLPGAPGVAPVAVAVVSGTGGSLSAELDVSTVDFARIGAAYGVDVDLVATGRAFLGTDPATAGLTVDVSGTVGGAEVSLVGSAPDDLTFTLAAPGVDLLGRLAWDEPRRVVVSGLAGGQPVEAWLELDDAFERGRLHVDAPGAYLEAELATPEPGLRTAALSGELNGWPYGLTGTLGGRVEARGGDVELVDLRAALSGVPGLDRSERLLVAGAGTLSPALDLGGTVAAAPRDEAVAAEEGGDGEASAGSRGAGGRSALVAAGEGTWRLGGEPLEASLAWLGLEASYGLADGAARVRAVGDVSPAVATFAPFLAAAEVAVEGPGLSWSRADGFGGGLTLTAVGGPVPPEATPVTLELRGAGDGRLAIEGQAGRGADGGPLGRLAAAVPADLPLKGSFTAEVVVSGAVEAAGTLTASARGLAVQLAGEGLALSASAGADGWAVDGALDELPVRGVLPLRGDPTVSLRVTGGSATGGLAVEDLVVSSGSSSLRGSASLDGRLRAALRAQVDLADLDLGDTRLTGLLRGPVVLVAPDLSDLGQVSVTAQLDAAGVGVAGVPAHVDGTLQVGGSAMDPVVFAALTGSGDLRGSLRLEAAPRRGRVDLRSTLGFGDLTSDVRVAVAGDDVLASGTLRAGNAVLLVSDVGGRVTLTGAGRLDGWQGVVSAGLGGLEVEGPLAALSPALSGSAAIALGAPAAGEGAWLRGTLTGLALSGQPLGDLTLSSAAAGAPISLAGEGVSAEVDPADQSWRAVLSAFPLPGDLTVDLEASGRGAEGRAAGRVAGGGELGVDLALEAGFGPGGAATLTAAGTVMGGRLDLAGERRAAGEWVGEVALQGARAPAAGGAVLTATGVLQGNQLVPQVVLATAAWAEGARVAAAGRVAAGTAGVTLDQTIALPGATAPLRVQGRVAPGLDVTVAGLGTAAGQPRGEFRLTERPDGLAGAGALEVPLGPVTARLSAGGSDLTPRLNVTPAAVPEASLTADLAADDLAELVARVAREGLVVTGAGAASGTALLTASGGGALELQGLGVALAGFHATLSGTLAASAASLEGTVELPLETNDPAARVLPLEVSAADGRWRLSSRGRLGEVEATYDAATGAALVDVALELPAGEDGAEPIPGVAAGSVTARVAFGPGAQPSGTLTVSGVRLTPPGWGAVTVDADASLADGRLGGAATVTAEAGSLSVSGDAPLERLLAALGAAPADPGGPAAAGAARGDADVELRLRAVDLAGLPAVAAVAPHVSGALSGVVRLQGDFVFGQLVAPELAVGDTRLPVTVQLSGPTSRVDAAVTLGSSLVSLTLSDLTLSGSARLERFPLDLLAEAVVGPSDVTAFVTGVARVDLPLASPGDGYVALASEELTLERAGVVTRGDVTLVFDDGALAVERAEFTGRGDWRAGGVLAADRLDFELVADQADFGPLLGLFPTLALYGVGAEGSFTFTASGSLAEPRVAFRTDALDFEVAGTRYRLADTDVRLEGAALSARATLSALEPVRGDLRLEGDATLVLEPVSLRAADLRFEGALVVPGIGRIDQVTGSVTQDPLYRPYLALFGSLGAPVAVQGTLVPLDLRGGGTGLRIAYPGLLIADSTLAADLRLVAEEGGVALSGLLAAEEVVIDPGVAAQAEAAAGVGAEGPGDAGADAGAEGPAGGAGDSEAGAAGDSEAGAAEPLADSVVPEQVAPSPVSLPVEAAPGALAGLRFDGVRITAPQRVVMATSFASLEAALDLTLTGTGADPRLTGEARALRGNLRFSGREFTVDEAVATFSENRGVLPELAVRAHTEFEKARVLTGATDVDFVAPEGRTFRVDLAFSGPVERDERGGIRFDVRPTLTSEALIEVGGDPAAAAGNGVRPLTEAELLSLVTLGRLELGSDLIGAGGLGGAVAQGAIDTAVDVLLLGELQNALREALGLDVLEIRTSALSQILEGGTEPFGVSVRLGGYLNPDLFASYRIGTADPDDPGFAVTNEVALRYALGPLDLEVSGRLDFPQAGVLAAPRSELGLGIAYDVGRSLGLDLSSSLSTERSVISFGVTLRW